MAKVINTNWRRQRRDPSTGKWIDTTPGLGSDLAPAAPPRPRAADIKRNAATQAKKEKLAKRQQLVDRVNATVDAATRDNSVANGGSGGYTPNGGMEMGPDAMLHYTKWLDEFEADGGNRKKPGQAGVAAKIRAINATNPNLTDRQRLVLGDNLPTTKISKKILAREAQESAARFSEDTRAELDAVPSASEPSMIPLTENEKDKIANIGIGGEAKVRGITVSRESEDKYSAQSPTGNSANNYDRLGIENAVAGVDFTDRWQEFQDPGSTSKPFTQEDHDRAELQSVANELGESVENPLTGETIYPQDMTAQQARDAGLVFVEDPMGVSRGRWMEPEDAAAFDPIPRQGYDELGPGPGPGESMAESATFSKPIPGSSSHRRQPGESQWEFRDRLKKLGSEGVAESATFSKPIPGSSSHRRQPGESQWEFRDRLKKLGSEDAAAFDPTPRQGYDELGPGPGPGESMAESAGESHRVDYRVDGMGEVISSYESGSLDEIRGRFEEMGFQIVGSSPGLGPEMPRTPARSDSAQAKVDADKEHGRMLQERYEQRLADQAIATSLSDPGNATPSGYHDMPVAGHRTFRGGAWDIDTGQLQDGRWAADFSGAAGSPGVGGYQRQYFDTEEEAVAAAKKFLGIEDSISKEESALEAMATDNNQRVIDSANAAGLASSVPQELDYFDESVKEIANFRIAAQAFSDLGSSVQGQLEDYLEDPERTDLNPNAVAMIEDFLDEHSTDGLNNLLQASFDVEAWKEYDALGSSVQEQMESILNGEPFEEQNPNALEMISDFLRSGMGFEGSNVAIEINDYLESIRKPDKRGMLDGAARLDQESAKRERAAREAKVGDKVDLDTGPTEATVTKVDGPTLTIQPRSGPAMLAETSAVSKVHPPAPVKVTIDWYGQNNSMTGEGMGGSQPNGYNPPIGTQFKWQGDIWEVIAQGEKGWIPAVPASVAREIEGVRRQILALTSEQRSATPDPLLALRDKLEQLERPYQEDAPDFKYGEVELEIVGDEARRLREQWGKPANAKKSLDLDYYDAAFAEVELSLSNAGMNTKNGSDWTIRRLEKAMAEAEKIPDRGKLSDDQFANPEDRSYPIPDEPHAKLALGRCKGTLHEDQVRAAVIKKFPQLKEYAAQVLDGVAA